MPRTVITDEDLTELIRRMIIDCPFAGEGHPEVRARLRGDHQLHVEKNRVWRLMRTAGLHAGVVITPGTQRPKGTDATMAWTKDDGWVWVFALLDHHTDEAWAHVAKIGNRFAALQPVYDAVIDRSGTLDPDIARDQTPPQLGQPILLRPFPGLFVLAGHRRQCRLRRSASGQQCLWSRLFADVDDLRQGVAAFIDLYNNEWLIEHLGHRTPREAFRDATTAEAAKTVQRTGTPTPLGAPARALRVLDVPRETWLAALVDRALGSQKSGLLVGMPVRRGNLSGVPAVFARTW